MSIMILCLQGLAILFFTALIHEGGHALACRFCGIPVLEMMIFSGSQKYRLQFGRFAIGWFPYGGYIATPFIHLSLEIDFFITICGPAANIIVGAGAFFSTGMLQLFFIYNLLTALYSLLPISKNKDGYRLLLIIKKWNNSRRQCR